MQQDCEGFEAIPDKPVAEPKVELLHEYIKTLELESEQKTKVIKDLLLMLESQQQ